MDTDMKDAGTRHEGVKKYKKEKKDKQSKKDKESTKGKEGTKETDHLRLVKKKDKNSKTGKKSKKETDQASKEKTKDTENNANDERLSESDQFAIWKHGAISRGDGFLESEKEFIVKELRKAQGSATSTPSAPVIQKIIDNGKDRGILFCGWETELQYFEKVRNFIRNFLKLAASDDND